MQLLISQENILKFYTKTASNFSLVSGLKYVAIKWRFTVDLQKIASFIGAKLLRRKKGVICLVFYCSLVVKQVQEATYDILYTCHEMETNQTKTKPLNG